MLHASSRACVSERERRSFFSFLLVFLLPWRFRNRTIRTTAEKSWGSALEGLQASLQSFFTRQAGRN